MKKTLHTYLQFSRHFLQKSVFLLSIILLSGSASIAQSDVQVNGSIIKTFNINARGTQGSLAVDPNALYSNVTTFSGSYYINGGATILGDTTTITTLVADSLGLIGTLPFSINQFRFSIVNLNTVNVSARPRIRFYANDGTGGGPGKYLGGFSFNPITFTASTVQVINTGVLAASFVIPTQAFWAGITFDDNSFATGITIDQLNNLGMGIYDPIDVGSSTSGFFQTNEAGSFFGDNPAGSFYAFTKPPPANFGWEFVSSIPLPVTLTDFKVQRSGISNTLSWKTSQELNSNFFSIQKSIDGINFTEIGQVKAAGKSETIKSYSFADAAPKKGINYYRIRMVDLDNSGRFGEIRNIRNDALLVLSIYPNPVWENLILEWNSENAGKAAITITDMAGRTLYNKEAEIANGNNKITIDAASFAKGVYNIKVTTGEDSYTRTFNKL
ncbi:MAG: T9SS type A sorting domain-containing protein [Ginsengibacter sp.]